MPYVTAVFDRAQSDIDNRTSKAFLNASDWTRIYGNAGFVNDEVETALGLTILFETVTTPTITTIPTAADVNKLTGNIERLRVIAEAEGTSAGIKDDWIGGASQQAPNYKDANRWEETLDLIHNAYSDSPVRFARTGVAECGVGKTRNNQWRHYA